jgi:hypothetical protein
LLSDIAHGRRSTLLTINSVVGARASAGGLANCILGPADATRPKRQQLCDKENNCVTPARDRESLVELSVIRCRCSYRLWGNSGTCATPSCARRHSRLSRTQYGARQCQVAYCASNVDSAGKADCSRCVVERVLSTTTGTLTGARRETARSLTAQACSVADLHADQVAPARFLSETTGCDPTPARAHGRWACAGSGRCNLERASSW